MASALHHAEKLKTFNKTARPLEYSITIVEYYINAKGVKRFYKKNMEDNGVLNSRAREGQSILTQDEMRKLRAKPRDFIQTTLPPATTPLPITDDITPIKLLGGVRGVSAAQGELARAQLAKLKEAAVAPVATITRRGKPSFLS